MPLVALRFLLGHRSQVLSVFWTHSQESVRKVYKIASALGHSQSYAIPAKQALPHPRGFSPRPTLVESFFSRLVPSCAPRFQQLSLNEWRLLKIVLRNMTVLSLLACARCYSLSWLRYCNILICVHPECSSSDGTKIRFCSLNDFCSSAVVLRVYERGHAIGCKCQGDSVSGR